MSWNKAQLLYQMVLNPQAENFNQFKFYFALNFFKKQVQLKQVAEGFVHWILSISEDGDCATCWGDLFQCIITLMV